VDTFAGRAKNKGPGAHSIEELIKSLKRPRKIMIMVKQEMPSMI
jgi:6-phosphogluconate dehydrogenase